MEELFDFGDATKPAVYLPESRSFPPSSLPPAIVGMLARNETYSRFFGSKKADRARFFNDYDYQLVVNDCIDERRAKTAQSLGESDPKLDGFFPPGAIEVIRGAGARILFRSQAACALEMKRVHQLKSVGMRELRLPLAHWSSSQPRTASCAAFGHDTRAALDYVRGFSAKTNYFFRETCVAIHALADTDNDSLRVFGPNDSVNTMELANQKDSVGEQLVSSLEERLVIAFPKKWDPLAALGKKRLIESFHRQLAEHLACNVEYVRANLNAPREFQRFEHTGKYVLVGRHLESEARNGAAFVISDLDADFNRCLFIALKYVGKNVITASEAADDWVIPIHVNIPHNGDEYDRRVTAEYARETGLRAIERAIKIRKALAAFWLNDEHGVPKKHRHAIERQLEEGIERHLAVTISISNRDDRLFRLVDMIKP